MLIDERRLENLPDLKQTLQYARIKRLMVMLAVLFLAKPLPMPAKRRTTRGGHEGNCFRSFDFPVLSAVSDLFLGHSRGSPANRRGRGLFDKAKGRHGARSLLHG